jgi:CheY-specific phosphatase CheX
VDNQEIMSAQLRESCKELFESIQVASRILDKRTAGAAGRQIASVLGFNGWQIRGSLTVRSTVGFFEDTHPVAKTSHPVGQDGVVDWAGEFTNQLLGRFKNKMLAYGLDFQVGVPVTIYGENLVEASVGAEGVVSYQFRTSSNMVSVTFVGRLMPGVELFAEPEGRTAAQPGKPIHL